MDFSSLVKYEEGFSADIGDVIMVKSGAFWITRENSCSKNILLISLSSTHKCGEYDDIHQLNRDLKQSRYYNTASERYLDVINVYKGSEVKLVFKGEK